MKIPKWARVVIGMTDKMAEPFVPPPFRTLEDYVVHQVLQIKDTTLPTAVKRKRVKKILSKI
jgi:hypothetical protein